MRKIEHIVISKNKWNKNETIEGVVTFLDKNKKLIDSFEFGWHKDLNELKSIVAKHDGMVQKEIDDKKQGRLF